MQEEVLEQFHSFYKVLFSSEDGGVVALQVRGLIKGLIPKKIADEDVVKLEADLTKEEIRKEIFSMSNDKSPGCDELPIEFF